MLQAFNDRLSVENVYYAKQPGLVIISNRVRLISEVLDMWNHDVENLAWLSLTGYIIGDGTSVKEVKKIPQGSRIKAKLGKMELLENPLFMYDDNVCNVSRVDLNSFINLSIKHCMTNIQTCFNLSPESPLPLSGGKDSRAILALLLKTGLSGQLNAFTNGYENHPDVIVASKIAKKFNINHTVNKPKPPQKNTDRDILLKLMGHVFQTDGMLGAWDARGYWAAGNNLVFAGHIGEVYRGYNQKGTKLTNVSNAARLFHDMGLFDSANIMYKNIRARFEKILEERIIYYLDNGAEISDIPELIYTVERIPNWVGCLRRNDGYSNSIINALNTENFVKLAFALGSKQREIERIHFEIINRSNTFLAELPFANDKWSEYLKAYANKTKISNKIIPVPKGLPTFGTWQHIINNSDNFKNSIKEIITSFPDSLAWNYYDKDAVLENLKCEKLSYTKLISLYGFITLFFKIHSIEVPMKILLPVNDRNMANNTNIPVKASNAKTIYIYDGTKNFKKMHSWNEYLKSGLSKNPVINVSELVFKLVT